MNDSYIYNQLDIAIGHNSVEYQVWENQFCYLDPSVLMTSASHLKYQKLKRKNLEGNGRRITKERTKLFGIWIWYLFFSLLFMVGMIIIAGGYISAVVEPVADAKTDPNLWSLSEILAIVGAGLLATGIGGLPIAYGVYHDIDITYIDWDKCASHY